MLEPLRDQHPRFGKDFRYISLSHCWGGRHALETTKATFKDRKHGIAWSSLSNTFKETVLLTKALGVDYVWIDSICIIQDDLESWARGAASMAEIYRNAYLTIGATSAENGDRGIFPRERPSIHVIS